MSSALCGAGKSRVRTRQVQRVVRQFGEPCTSFPFVSTFGYPKFVEKNFCQIVLLQQLVGARLFFQVLFIFELIKKLKRWVTSGMCKFIYPDLYGEAMLKTKTSVEERWQLY